MPKKRPYDQYCPIATALDRIGDRWSLLIVRELFAGPARYSELLEDLDGVATDVLATRLRELESLGVITRQPGGYELTDDGRGLIDVLRALARWGRPHLGRSRQRDQLRAGRAVQLLAVAGVDVAESTVIELDADGQVFTIAAGPDGTVVRRGSHEPVDTRVTTDGPTLWALSEGRLDWATALAGGDVTVGGDATAAERILG